MYYVVRLQRLKPAGLREILDWVNIWTSANPETVFFPPLYPGRVSIPSADSLPRVVLSRHLDTWHEACDGWLY